MGKNVTTDGLATVSTSEEGAGSRITLDLICQQDGDIEFCVWSVHAKYSGDCRTFGDMRQLREKLIELLLTLIEFTTTGVVDAKQRHDTVDDEKAVLVPDEELCDLVQQLHLMLRVDGTSVGDVVLSCSMSVA